jgi:TolA-binding protein
MRLGEINEETFVINSCDATRKQIRDLASLLHAAGAPGGSVAATQAGDAPGSTGMSIAVDDRIRELEAALQEERRALAEAEERYRELERKYNELLHLAAASRS